MNLSVKILWAGAGLAIIGAAAAVFQAAAWGAVAFTLAASALTAAAFAHNKTCVRQRREAEALKEETLGQVLAARREAEETRARCDEEVMRAYARIVHSLRAPIAVIIGYAELIRDGFADEQAVRDAYIRKICAKTAYMNELLRQILLEMRTGRAEAPIHKQPVRLLELLRKVTSDMEIAAAKRGVRFKLMSEREEIVIEGDALGLTKVFYNIIDNALKYMGRPGSVNITASVVSGDEVLIVFKDDGLGMKESETARVFELDYQGSNRAPGDGLGLYVVKTEVEAHGGRVSARSEPDKGMGVYLTLPVL